MTIRTESETHPIETAGDDLNAPWSLGFERDGTEDIAVITDVSGCELLRSRPFWLPQGDDPLPPTLAAMRLVVAAPALLSACRMVVGRWERGDLAEAARACQAAVELSTADGPPWDITEGRRGGGVPDATALLAALEGIIDYAESEAESLEKHKDRPEAESEAMAARRAIEAARAVIADAKAAGSGVEEGHLDIPGPAARKWQIAANWGVEDVQEIRPDLTADQAREVLQAADRRHDAAIGINWDVLACHAELLFGHPSETDEADEGWS